MRELDHERVTKLHAYFDGEVSAAERQQIEAEVGADEQASSVLADLKLLRGVAVASFDAEAARVPEARFEQIWDEIDRTLERDRRLQRAAETNVSVWSRVVAFVRPRWVPAVALAGVAAALTLYVTRDGGPDERSSGAAVVASKEAQALTDVSAAPAAVELPIQNEAEIERIEFGGRSGRIDQIHGKNGKTTTVIWFTEDDPTENSERSL